MNPMVYWMKHYESGLGNHYSYSNGTFAVIIPSIEVFHSNCSLMLHQYGIPLCPLMSPTAYSIVSFALIISPIGIPMVSPCCTNGIPLDPLQLSFLP